MITIITIIPILELIRLEENFEHGTFGILKISKSIEHGILTLEPADLENKQNVSSIPCQQYICQRIISPKFGETFQIMNVPGRTNVLFHKGNVIDNTLGCILMGDKFGKLSGDRAVLNSGKTFKRFMNTLKGYDQVHLTVSEHY